MPKQVLRARVAEDIRRCFDHAAEARKRSQRTTNPERIAEFLDIERHWLRLAQCYLLVQQMEHFIADGRREFPK